MESVAVVCSSFYDRCVGRASSDDTPSNSVCMRCMNSIHG